MPMRTFVLEQPRACVKIQKIGGRNRYRLLKGIESVCLMKEGTILTDFNGKLYDEDDNEVQPTGVFMISAETINPYHLLVDIF